MAIAALLAGPTVQGAAADGHQTPGNRTAAAVQKRLDAIRDSLGFPGATVSFVTADGQTLDFATGFADLESRRRLAVGDRMLSGSTGKSFAAAIALRLVEHGRLDLTASISRYLESEMWFRRLPNAGSITVRMLLDHTSGVPEYLAQPACLDSLREAPYRRWTGAERIACVLDERPLNAPGAKMRYADVNYILLGMVVERVTGRAYDDLLRETLEREGLAQSEPSDRPRLPGLVVGYSANLEKLGLGARAPIAKVGGRRLRRVIEDGQYAFNPQLEWAAGGLVTTAHDLARWARRLYGGAAISPASLRQMIGAGKRDLSGRRYGLGVEIRHSGYWGETYGHGGWMPGYHSAMEYFPDHRIAAAVQINTDDMGLANPRIILYELMKIVVPIAE